MKTRFEDWEKEIAKEYDALGHRLGWRFLCVSSKNLDPSTEIVLITANPGGNSVPKDHPKGSCENGSAYLVEKWGQSKPGQAPLQKQVQKLFAAIADIRGLGEKAGPELLTDSLIGYFIPFRSPKLDALPRRLESEDFGKRLWKDLFEFLRPKLIVTIDRGTYRHLQSILQTSTDASLVTQGLLDTGWANARANVDEYSGRAYQTMLLRLPHLSTYKLFSRSECCDPLQDILDKACKHLKL